MLKRDSLLKLCFIALAVVPGVLGQNIYYNLSFLGDSFVSFTSKIAFFLVKALILILFSFFLLRAAEKLADSSAGKAVDARPAPNYKLFFLGSFLINLIFLLPYYPGTSSWDTMYVIADFFDGTRTAIYEEGGNTVYTAFLNDHHPVCLTFLFSAFVILGDILGSAKIGVFIYSLLQIALYSFVYVRVLKYLVETKALPYSRYIIYIYYLFNPFLSYYAIYMSKDSLFSALFVLYLMEYFDAYFKRGKSACSPALILYSLIIPLVKKTGIYIVILSNLVLLIKGLAGRRHCWKKYAAGVVLPAAIMFYILPRILFPAIDVYPGGKQEVLATLFQQTALVKLTHEDAYSPDDAKIIDAVFDYEAIEEKFDKDLTDPIKNSYRLSTVTDEQLKDYFKLWLRTGLKYPATYLKATFSTCCGYFSPIQKLEVHENNKRFYAFPSGTIHRALQSPSEPVLREIDLSLSSGRLAVFGRNIVSFVFRWLCESPVTALPSYLVVYTWWIPLYGSYSLLRKKGLCSLFSMSPLYISILTLIVSPYSFARYIVSFVLAAPLVFFVSKAHIEDGLHEK